MAFLPFPVLFSPVALTDPWLSLFALGSVWMACSNKRPSLTSFLAGILAGLALGTKQQGLFLAPFSFLLTSWRRKEGLPRFFWLLGFLIPFAIVEWWDALRWATRPSFWDRSLVTYGGLGLVPWPELGHRFLKWLELLSWTAGGPVPAVLLTINLIFQLRGKYHLTRFDWAFLGFIAYWFALHWLLNFQVWDRYTLPLTPFLVALWARGLAGHDGRRWKVVVIITTLLFSQLAIRPDGLPAGSNYHLYDGVEGLAHYLREKAERSVTVYHRYLGWHLHFYLHGAEAEIRWYPSYQELVKDLKAGNPGEKLLAFAPFEDEESVIKALEQSGYLLEKLTEFPRPQGGSFKVYKIVSLPCEAGF